MSERNKSGRQWYISFLLLIVCLSCIQAHMLHYYKLKKLLTAVAFARALSRRPTILPIPIPIPIPIQQNEVIKIPAQGSKTVIALTGGGHQKHTGVGNAIHGGSLGKGYEGSSSYGYSIPGLGRLNNKVINLSSLNGLNSNALSFSSPGGVNSNALGGLTLLGTPSLGNSVLNTGSILDIGSPNIQLASNGVGPPFVGNLEGPYSLGSRHGYPMGANVYFKRKRKRRPYRSGGRRMRNYDYMDDEPEPWEYRESNKHYRTRYRPRNGNYYPRQRPRPQQGEPLKQNKKKKPIPVGEKFGWKP